MDGLYTYLVLRSSFKTTLVAHVMIKLSVHEKKNAIGQQKGTDYRWLLRLLTYPPPLFTSILVADDVYASALRTSCWLKKIPKKVHNWTRPSIAHHPSASSWHLIFIRFYRFFLKKRKFFLCELLIKSQYFNSTHPPFSFFSGVGGIFKSCAYVMSVIRKWG